jgi:hypothetical protein
LKSLGFDCTSSISGDEACFAAGFCWVCAGAFFFYDSMNFAKQKLRSFLILGSSSFVTLFNSCKSLTASPHLLNDL